MDLFNEVFDVITKRWADRRNDLATPPPIDIVQMVTHTQADRIGDKL